MANRSVVTVPRLKDYVDIVGESSISELMLIALHLKGKKIQYICSSRLSKAVTDMFYCAVLLMKELGVSIDWDVVETSLEFYNITRRLKNALNGLEEVIIDKDFDIYINNAHEYIQDIEIKGDIVFVHDLEPLLLIQNKKRLSQIRWVWVCHTDISSPNERVWEFISTFIEGYDGAVFYSSKFTPLIKIPRFIIYPAIDPLNDRNKELTDAEIDRVLAQYNIERDKPIILQTSAFDTFKDPLGVIEVFELVKRYIDVQLILVGSRAPEGFESERLLEDVYERAKNLTDVHILLIEDNDIHINAIQRASSVIIEKVFKEDFGLSVSEAIWKNKPVVASVMGGISLQIKHKYSGLLCYSVDGAALHIRQFLHNPEYARRLSENAKEHIKRNFLIIRYVRELMLLSLALFNEGDIIRL